MPSELPVTAASVSPIFGSKPYSNVHDGVSTTPSSLMNSWRCIAPILRSVHRREPLPPARVGPLPLELALGLCVRRAAHLGAHHHAQFPGEDPRQPAREMAGRLGAESV